MTATLGGLTFVGDGGAATYTIDELKYGAGSRRDSIPRPSAHGDFDVPVFLTGMLVTISGLIHASSVAEYEAAVDALTGLLADGSSSELEVTQAVGSWTAMVRRSGEPDVTHLVYGETGRYQVQFWAADPRRYGASHSFGPASSVSTVAHDGNFPADAVLEVAGSSGGGYTVTGPGSRLITVTEPLVSGHPHTVDVGSGALHVDGVRVLGGVSVFQPWAVPPGVTVSVSVSAGTVAVEVRDTFV